MTHQLVEKGLECLLASPGALGVDVEIHAEFIQVLWETENSVFPSLLAMRQARNRQR